MSNEEKILSMLTKRQSDIDATKKLLTGKKEPEKKMTQREVFMGLANLLNDDEKEALGNIWRRKRLGRRHFMAKYYLDSNFVNWRI